MTDQWDDTTRTHLLFDVNSRYSQQFIDFSTNYLRRLVKDSAADAGEYRLYFDIIRDANVMVGPLHQPIGERQTIEVPRPLKTGANPYGVPAMGTGTVSSTSAQRVVNNVMRHEYRVLTDEEKAQMQRVKDLGRQLHEFLDSLGDSRELSLAKTRLEEAVMWAVKHLTR